MIKNNSVRVPSFEIAANRNENAAHYREENGTNEAKTCLSEPAPQSNKGHENAKKAKVLIVGAGWYGCHCAMVCKSLGIAFDIADSENAIMTGSSTKNQNRLHLGFHYPRAYATRHECREGYTNFMAAYAHLTIEVPHNLYLVAKDSLIDHQTYANIFTFEGVPFTAVTSMEQAGIPFEWIENSYGGSFLTQERMIDCEKVAEFFQGELQEHLLKEYMPSDLDTSSSPNKVLCKGKEYDFVFDCTYGQLFPDPEKIFELSCSWVYRIEQTVDNLFGFTVMDGPFFSIYPYNPREKLYTLTHVAYTPLMTSKDIQEIRFAMSSTSILDVIQSHREKTVGNVQESIPGFNEVFQYQGHFLSIKCKSQLRADDRSLSIRRNKNVISFSGGKITGIFAMENYLRSGSLEISDAFTETADADRENTAPLMNRRFLSANSDETKGEERVKM